MSVGGTGIPRLQDLSYLEVALAQVAAGGTFENVRRAIVTRAQEIARDSDYEGAFDERKWDVVRADTKKHVHNTVEVLKELMRFGWIERQILPSGPSSSYLHLDTIFRLTEPGAAWVKLAFENRRDAYNALFGEMLSVHPQLNGFLRVIGAHPESQNDHLTIPLLRWNGARHRDETSYLNEFVSNVVDGVQGGLLGWSASEQAINEGIRNYVSRMRSRVEGRGKTQTRKAFISSCEEAVAKVAFKSAGCQLDYISMELLRRWTRFLGIGNFTYYAPGNFALRIWATATFSTIGGGVSIERRVGREIRRKALEGLLRVWQSRRAQKQNEMYVAIWELRAAVCWQQRISDEEFDKAIAELLSGVFPDAGFRLHLDQASVRATPGSTRPLVLPTDSGVRRVFNIATLIPVHSKEIA